MRILKPNYRNQRIYGMRAKTYLTVLLILVLLTPFVIAARQFKKQELITAKFYNQSHVLAKQLKDITTYKIPNLGNVTEQQRARIIIAKVWRADYKTGLALALCESGLQEKVVNSIGATGYFQINAPVHNVPVSEMQNGYANAGLAYALYKEQGLTPWVSSQSCWEGHI